MVDFTNSLVLNDENFLYFVNFLTNWLLVLTYVSILFFTFLLGHFFRFVVEIFDFFSEKRKIKKDTQRRFELESIKFQEEGSICIHCNKGFYTSEYEKSIGLNCCPACDFLISEGCIVPKA